MQEVKSAEDFEKSRRDNLTRRWNLPAQNKNFTGRVGLLDQISARLSGSTPLVITACHGLGGVGKTQLVTEFAYRNEKKYERIIWIPSESTDQIETAYLSLGQDLGIIPEKTPPAEAILMVKAWLTKHPRNLVIFDNAPDNKTVEGYELSSGADILITSRNTEWPEKGIEVDVFSPEDTVLYFIKVVGEREGDTKEKIEELGEKLGRLPLALAQAAAYIRQNKISIQAYLDLYQEKKAYLLSLNVLPEGDRHVAVHVTWDITMERIRQESILAPAILNICSYLHSEKIPTLLLEPFCEDEKHNPGKRETLDEARGCLRSYSMVSLGEEDNSVSVHRMVQEVTQLKLSDAERIYYTEIVYAQCVRCYPHSEQRETYSDTDLDIPLKRVLLPHLKAVARYIEDDDQKLVDISFLIENTYYLLGDAKRQSEILWRILPIAERHADTDAVITILSNLGTAFGAMGEVRKKRIFLEKALFLLEKHVELCQSELDVILLNLANAYGDLGKTEKKCELLLRALHVIEAKYGPNNFRRLKVLANLGNAYTSLHDFHKALETLLPLLPLFKLHYGETHPEYAQILLNVSSLYMQLGNNKKRYKYSKLALTIRENFYKEDPNHPKLAEALYGFGMACASVEGNVREGCDLVERARAIYVHCFGTESLEVARTLHSLMGLYSVLGEHELSERIREQAFNTFFSAPESTLALCKDMLLRLEEQQRDVNDPVYGDIYDRLGRAYLALGNQREARDALEKAVAVFIGSSADRLVLAKTWDLLGIIYHKFGESQRGCDVLERALKIKETEYSDNKKEQAKTVDYLTATYRGLPDFQKAWEMSVRALMLNVELYGRDSPEVASTLNQQGNICRDLKKPQEAIMLYEEALLLFERHCGFDDVNAGQAAMNLGAVYNMLGYVRKAHDFLMRTLKIYEINYGDDHPDMAKALNILGGICFSQQRYSKTLKIFSRAYNIVLHHPGYGEHHPETLAYQKNIQAVSSYVQRLRNPIDLPGTVAEVFELSQLKNRKAIDEYKAGNYKNALELFHDVRGIYDALGDVSPEQYASVMWNLGNTYKELGNFKQALTSLNHALNIRRTLSNAESITHTEARIQEVAQFRLSEKSSKHFSSLRAFFPAKKVETAVLGVSGSSSTFTQKK